MVLSYHLHADYGFSTNKMSLDTHSRLGIVLDHLYLLLTCHQIGAQHLGGIGRSYWFLKQRSSSVPQGLPGR